MSDRAEFEEWATSEWPKMYLTRKGDTGEYLYKTAEFAWSAWQAASQAPASGEVEPVAWMRWRSHRIAADDVVEGLEICEPGEVGDDGGPAFPVYTHPTPFQSADENVAWWKEHLSVHLATLFRANGQSMKEAERSAAQVISMAEKIAPNATPHPAPSQAVRSGAGVPERHLKALRTAMHHWMKDGVHSDDEEDATFCDEILQEILLAPQPADPWIKCSERLPTKVDADPWGAVHVMDGRDCNLPLRTHWGNVKRFLSEHPDAIWTPTGLNRPNSPEQETE